ncbi:MAG: hypothetical protein IAX21_02490 [Candidatus Bathyarchaeota archaeon]|nr:hypothetical protein [Candidatus Bathyarchaeum tardum]WGM90113.1 MAG: hypothetical protein NUK63_03085 [Candidatus Bathyarchaeum tardum]WNZ29749.1 MAG: hypothetical protein IAX21_02490 [Candidatus Bathyarchaeota archaeon]
MHFGIKVLLKLIDVLLDSINDFPSLKRDKCFGGASLPYAQVKGKKR